MDPHAWSPTKLVQSSVSRSRIVSRAETTGGPATLDDADPVVTARAVRRALAAAGRKAVEVDILCVAAPLAPTAEACRRLARRALGPHGSQVPALGVAVVDVDAEALALAAAVFLEAAATSDEAPLAEGWALAVCVGLGADGTTVALCLAR